MPHDSEQHAQHDQLLVVSLAAGDLTGADRDRAASQIATCAECALLNDDLLTIARATAALPAAVRPRDFQLSPEQAARLRPAGWRRFVAAFASPRLAMTRQLGVGLTTLGIAGVLVSVLGSVDLGMTGSAAAPAGQQELLSGNEFTDSGSKAAPSAAAAAVPAASAPAASAAATEAVPVFGGAQTSASPDTGTSVLPDDTSGPVRSSSTDRGTTGVAQVPPAATAGTPAPDAQRDLSAEVPADERGVPLILVASAVLLAAGIALLLARRIARNITTG